MDHFEKIAKELNISVRQVSATSELLDADATVPFIARYRKEVTGNLDEVVITSIRDRSGQLRELDKRREAIITSLDERDLLTDELSAKINAAETMVELEDIYLPFRPKRRTRATIAIERGLEPLAESIFEQTDFDVYAEAEKFIDEEKEVASVDDALAGARDIIAAWINEDADARAKMRALFLQSAVITSRVVVGKEEEGVKYKDYFDWSEPVSKSPSHRILAMRRGEAENILALKVAPEEDEAHELLDEMFVSGDNDAADQVLNAIEDCYKRLLGPSMETEIRLDSKGRADFEAIRIFSENLRELLMSSPLGQHNVLAIDPGFRTGCKVVCLNRQGKLVHNETIFPLDSEKRKNSAIEAVEKMRSEYNIEVIAIGNGTAGRETEAFIRELNLPGDILIEMVNESGASVYSASAVAREEFPDYDITVRGAVSIGRRLMDPLAELVKIDPKSIGVGQYQHDVDQPSLKNGLDDTVMSCVNGVGVEINTASKQLLTYVSGLGPTLAGNIVTYRDKNGPFSSRDGLLQVPRLGPKAFEQSAGFLRITDAINPLDRSAVHPESYPVVARMAKDLSCTVTDLMSDDSIRNKISLNDYVSDKVGMLTLQDIKDELAKPGRDPRQKYERFSFDDSVHKIDDVKAGMKLPGIITNVAAFGAFVDIGVHQDGLIHISELADRFVKDPNEIVKVNQKVKVTVLDVDINRKRISLSLKQDQ
ncbi:MAG: RNA-binding transcriptional accessory protein [candidate division Zixibacteria bacterium]|nr:RNA-binding transcriptional accessory protein [candidate division Zixibacteria bacterium]